MAYIYILQSEKTKNYYIGSSQNFEKRYKEHLAGRVRSTKALLPLKVVLKQSLPDIDIAKKLELRLKKFKRRDFIEKIVKDGKVKSYI